MDIVTRSVILFFAFFLFSTLVFSQQLLNLDFEKMSNEGPKRPWGWTVNAFNPNTRFVCDSLQSHAGKYSLKIENDNREDDGFFELVFFVEPNQIINQKIRLQAWLKADALNGEAGIRVHTVGAQADTFAIFQDKKDFVRSAGGDWQQLEIELTLGESLHTLNVSTYLSGNGMVRFDDFHLFIDGKKVDEVPVAPVFSKKEIKWLSKNSKPFASVAPIAGVDYSKKEFGDFKFFKKLVGDAQIIALGEATHGTSEFFKVKHRLLQYAIHEIGIRIFALEDNQLKVERINDFVLHGKGAAGEVIKGLFAVWNTHEMLHLIQWVRDYNIAHPNDPVEFVGFDVQNPELAIKGLETFLKEKDPDVWNTCQELLQDYFEGWNGALFQEESVLASWKKNAERILDIVESKKEGWQEKASNKTDLSDIEWAIQNARLINQNIYSAMTFGFEGRDEAMADNIEWILSKRKKGSRMLVWAHDSHINRGEAPEKSDNYFLGQAMGAHLAKKFGENYKAFGLSTYQGTCRGTISYQDFTQISFQLFTSPEGSLDEGLHQIAQMKNRPLLILNLNPAKNDQKIFEWINIQRPVRYVGYVSEDYGFGGRYRIPYQFDGIIFVDESKASNGIK